MRDGRFKFLIGKAWGTSEEVAIPFSDIDAVETKDDAGSVLVKVALSSGFREERVVTLNGGLHEDWYSLNDFLKASTYEC